MSKKLPLPEGNIVETYHFGETTVHICDSYSAKTPEHIAKVVRDMHDKGWAIVRQMNYPNNDGFRNRIR